MSIIQLMKTRPTLWGGGLWLVIILLALTPAMTALQNLSRLEAERALSQQRLEQTRSNLSASRERAQTTTPPKWLLSLDSRSAALKLRADVTQLVSAAGMGLTFIAPLPDESNDDEVLTARLRAKFTGSYTQWLDALEAMARVQELFLAELRIEARGLERFDDRLDIEAVFIIYHFAPSDNNP
jgi:hypothetical protein